MSIARGVLPVVIAVFCVCFVLSCAKKASSPEAGIILRLQGTRVMATELAPLLAAKFLERKGAKDIRRVEAKDGAVIVQGLLPGMRSPQGIEIRPTSSDAAFECLRQAFCDIAMSARLITAREKDNLARIGLGDMTSPSNQFVIGVDCVAIIVNPDNRLNTLTREQVANIFAGAIAHWSQITPFGSGTVKVNVLDDSSVIHYSVREIVAEFGSGGKLAARAQRFKTGDELSENVSNDPLAIGAVRIPDIRRAKSVAIVGRAGGSFHPNHITVGDGDYPLARRLYLYAPSTSEGSLTKEFVSFALSPEGQEVVRSSGFIKASDVKSQKGDR